jgi:hypothetical protein
MDIQHCTCPSPFTEDDLICDACMRAEMELYERLHAGVLPTGDAWDDFVRQQG